MVGHLDRDAIQHAVKIVVPERAAIFAVGNGLQADVFLLLDDLDDFLVLDRLQLGVGDLTLFVFGARFVDSFAAQNAADLVGAERRLGTLGHFYSPGIAFFRA